MFGIGEFFKRVQNIHTKELFARDAVRQSIKKHAGVDIDLECVSFKNKDIVIKGVPHAALSVLYIKKQAIIAEVNSLQDAHTVSDIRF